MERVSRGDYAMNKRRAAEIAKLGSIYNPNWSQYTQDEDGQERVLREECWGRPQESRRGLLKLIPLATNLPENFLCDLEFMCL